MFGGGGATGGFGGFGQQQQQQQQQQAQQQQQQPGAFGAAQPAQTGFGFGAQQPQQQQPQQPAAGGLFGAPSTQSAPFAFGQANNTAAGGGGLFGAQQNKPAPTGFGGFGAVNNATAPAGGGFTFGAGGSAMQPAQAQTGALFGGGGAATGAFGAKPAGSGLFAAQQPQTNTFGAVGQTGGGMFGTANTAAAGAMPTQGSSNPPYQPHVVTEKDNNNTTSNFSYQSITCLPAYRNASFEELRVQDYQQGRKTGNAGPAAGATFGGFGQQQQQQPQQAGQAGGAFGQPAQTGGLFGQPAQQANTGGIFGQQQQQQPQTGGLFGQQPQAAGGIFGQNNAQQQQTGGLFGQNKPGGLFGQNTQQPAQQAGGLFGAQQPQQQQQGQTGFSFGGAAAAAQPAASTGGFTFGAAANNNQAKPGGLFGAPAATTNTFGGFGQNTQQGQAAGAFGFGAANNAAKPGGLFGNAGATATPASTGFGGFGATSAAAANQPKPAFSFGQAATTPAPGAFGANTGAQPAAGGGLFGGGATGSAPGFGAASTAAAPAAGGGLFGGGAFGAKPAGGGLFGNAGNTAQPQPASGGLFGNNNNNAAGGGGLFGAKPAAAQTGGLFGGFGAQQQQQPAAGAATGFGAGGGGLFGQQAQAKPGGLFGTNNAGGGGLFGNNAGQAGAAGGGGGLFGQSTAGGGLFGSTLVNAQPAAGGAAPGFGAGAGVPGFGQSLNFGQQNLTQSQILAQSVAQGLAKGIDADPYGTEALFRSTAGTNGSSMNGLSLGNSTMGASLGHQPFLPFSSVAKEHQPRFGLGASTASNGRESPFRPTARSSAKTLRYRSATPSLGLFAGTASVGAGTHRESTPGATREGSIGPGSPAALRTGSPSIFRALGNDSGLPSQAFTSRPSVKRLVLNDGGGSVAGSPSANRTGSVNPFESPSREFGGARRSGTVPPGRGVNFSPAFEVSASQSRLSRAGAADSDASFSFAGRGPRGVADDSPSKGDGASRNLFGDRSLGDTSNTRTSAHDNDADVLPGGYKMSPTLSELRRMTKTELQTVRDFTVSRSGFGSIRFLPPVDLSGISDLTSIAGGVVQIRAKECYVYPEKADCTPGTDGMKAGYVPGPKAAQGEALNVPAVVTLDKCWPLDRATREPIKDPEHPRYKQHIAKLKKIPETKFIDFHAPTGAWQFQVEHFSRYGLDSEDEDSEDAAATAVTQSKDTYKPKLKPIEASPSQARKTSKSMNDIEEDDDDDDDEDDDDAPPNEGLGDSTTEGDSIMSTTNEDDVDADDTFQAREIPVRRGTTSVRIVRASPAPEVARPNDLQAWATERGVQPEKVQVMQASLFGARRTGAGDGDGKVGAQAQNVSAVGPVAVRKHPRASSVQPETGPVSPEARNGSRPNFTTGIPAATMPTSGPRARKFTRTDLAQSISHGQESIRADAGLCMGRSFRVGWGPGGLLVHNGVLAGVALSSNLVPSQGSKRASEQSITSVRLQKVLTSNTPAYDGILDPIMDVQLQNSIVEYYEQDDCPAAQIAPTARFYHFSGLFDIGDHSQEATIWRLGHALFDEIDLELPGDPSQELKKRVTALKRKEALSDWLQQAVQQTVEAESRSHVAMSRTSDTLFSYLSGYQLQRACMAAIDSGDLHLSTLIAQVPGDDEHGDDLADQLATWRKEGVDAHISKQHLRLYELLSGNVNRSEANKAGNRDPSEQVEAIDIGAGLDWKRAFGLHLWYGVPHEADLNESLASYDRAVHELRTAAPPMPAYREKAHIGELRLRELVKARSYDRDVLFELIKLAVDPSHDLETALGPCNFGPSQTDYRLPWHLHILLSHALKVRHFQDRTGVVETRYTFDADDAASLQGYSARSDALTADFANELELAGKWTSAVFVLLHLQSAVARRRAIRDVLARCVEGASEAEIAFVIHELCVPEEWVHEARAYLKRYRDDRYEEFLSLAKADLLSEAHDVATKILIPEAIVRTDHQLVMRILGFLTHRGGANLPEWNYGGKLYVDYVACVWHLSSLLNRRLAGTLDDEGEEQFLNIAASIERIQVGLPQLLPLGDDPSDLEKNPSLACIRATQQMTRSQMLSVLSYFGRDVTKVRPEIGPSGPGWDVDFPPAVEVVQSLAQDHFNDLFHP
ncbi:unnamed protein product [Tilletia laevis]|uniref:Peptidase S59 domain-containing protein n=2 Tax=Tilletia TaxID=13289 RepID=A0A177VA28_9BASI|nr:hypothetical protein CF336_g2128 [Tilletia laevis]KAE8263397.1 hypothetical protein A4X03_0g1713 [Tilletia caries]KAE8206999.1 hypothetical protein CF335_g1468 [Tilletia laevis]CAD6883917.1 unnamed protein product [Tilletia caries]CAD6902048.1 unnamed protein product [Tilletia laevis]